MAPCGANQEISGNQESAPHISHIAQPQKTFQQSIKGVIQSLEPCGLLLSLAMLRYPPVSKVLSSIHSKAQWTNRCFHGSETPAALARLRSGVPTQLLLVFLRAIILKYQFCAHTSPVKWGDAALPSLIIFL